MKILKVLPLILLLALAVFQFSLGALPELVRLTVWHLSQLYMPAIGIVILIAGFIFLAARKRWKSKLGWATIVAALVIGVLPYILLASGVRYPASIENTRPHISVRVPLEGPVRVAWGGDQVKTNYHAAYPDQRWAYDLVVEPYFSASENLEDYGCYGQPVYAPLSGKVWRTESELPDAVPGKVSNNYLTPLGNHVMIQVGDTDSFVMIAHLQPGSVLVAQGDEIEEGQQIGACGNSGNTSEPHVHIHTARYIGQADSPVDFGYGLPLFFRDHVGPSMPAGGLKTEQGMVIAIGDEIRHVGTGASN